MKDSIELTSSVLPNHMHCCTCTCVPLSVRPMKGRIIPPCHCLFKIESFSTLSKASVENYTSEEFEAGGYQWTLSIYPTGNKKKDGQHHISAYLNLMVSSSSSFPVGWEVNAIVNLFVYDFLRDEYFSYQDASTRHFHMLQTEWGISKFVDLVSFNDHSNGFLIEDACVFGAEIFVIKPPSKREHLSMIHEPPLLSYRWKFDNFSKVNLEKYESELFPAGNYRWKLVFYPNGTIEGKGNSVSLFLTVDTSSLPSNTKLYAHCILRVKDQVKGQHAETKFYRHFSSSNPTWGSRTLVPLATFKDPTKGFLEANSCILETEIKVLGLVKPL
ncbi:hypothetical protein QN277_021639 [Acacia crassicarpa]|uniref:MATH domain-containing protein n=1 Tax=Acacia crassicarpa TaxID=499986 RepID=A0AAE1MTL7_9FABA|nr:hypothetical protein QN277_021639 [Acacia crassicarpa]